MHDEKEPHVEDHQIKEECINHMFKLLGSALRKLSKQVSMEVTAEWQHKGGV